MKLFRPFRASRMKRISVREAKRGIPPSVMSRIRETAEWGESVAWVARDPESPPNLGQMLETLGYRVEWAYNGPSSGYWVRW